MTPAQRAWHIDKRLGNEAGLIQMTPDARRRYLEIVEEEIRAAVEEEREACAKIADGFVREEVLPHVTLKMLTVDHECLLEECCAASIPPKIAAAIRARKETP